MAQSVDCDRMRVVRLPAGRLSAPSSFRVFTPSRERSEQVDMSSQITDRGRQAAAVSNAITRMHREHYGRGATTTRTIIQRNYVVCFLEDIYTAVERTLIDAGRTDAVRETRNIFQDAMGPRFKAAVEEATGRQVIAFMSQ